jgi:hypothetical protein
MDQPLNGFGVGMPQVSLVFKGGAFGSSVVVVNFNQM